MSKIHSALESIARRDVPENTNLWPQIAVRIERKDTVDMNPRFKLAWTVVLVLLVILAISSVAYAVGNMLGYIPGIGFIDRGSPLRVLAEPVSQTRDGVTITVTKAVLSTDKTVIVFKVEGLSSDKYSPLEPLNTCFATEELRLPNGKSIPITSGTSDGTLDVLETSYESTFNHAGIPADVNEATLFIPCISGALAPGILPENWELPLRFVPAPPEMTVIPVIEVTLPPASVPHLTSTPNADNTPAAPDPGTTPAEQNPLAFSKIMDIGDSYVFIVDFNLPAPSQTTNWYTRNNLEQDFSDGNGQEVRYDPDQSSTEALLPLPDDPHEEYWAFKIAKGFTLPLHMTVTYQYNYAANSVAPYTFEFDAGANPQPGQEWKLNKDFQWGGHTIHLTTITAVQNGYRFSFGPEEASVFGYSVGIDGYTPPPTGFGGGGGGDTPGENSSTLIYSEMPKGKLKLVLSDLILIGDTKNWTLDWTPADSFPAPIATP